MSQGHIGGIYQASNWVFTGITNSKYSYIDKYGHKWHDRLVSESGFVKANGKVTKAPKPSECTKWYEPGKYRYLMPLDDDMRKQIELLKKPYPKKICVESVESDTPSFQDGKGGAVPTSTLFIKNGDIVKEATIA
jgi:hypothetical protein